MTDAPGTRELADGRPAYRLVRRDDIELRAALPGRSSGLTTCRLVDGSLGSTHMALTLVSLADGHVDEHLHSFETSFYVLERRSGALSRRPRGPVEGRRMRRDTDRAAPRVPRARHKEAGSRWRHPAPVPTAATPSSSARRPTSRIEQLDVRDPRNRNLFLLGDGEMDVDRLKHGAAVSAPTVSASMATAVLAYSGIAVKMLVDQRLDAQLHTMFMVDYQPGAVAHPHDHPFEESYYMLEGEVDVVANGDRHTLRPGDAFWTGVGCVHAFYETQGGRVRWLETSAPGPPATPFLPLRARLGLPARAARVERRRRSQLSQLTGSPAAGALDDLDLYARIYRQMLLIRGFEELVQSLFLKGEVYGTTHLYSGQEAVATGRREPPRRRGSRRGDLSRPRARARAGSRSAEAPRRDARA